MNIKYGSTRAVFLTKKWAFKFPRLVKTNGQGYWYYFLQGLLANMKEVYWYKNLWTEKYCPIKFYFPGGFLIVMPRIEPLTDKEFDSIVETDFLNEGNYFLPVEYKKDSFGKLNGKFVAVDYGD